MLVTRVFYENQKTPKRIVVDRGGAGSSKTYSVMQLMMIKMCEERGKRILVLRKTLPSARNSVMVTWSELLERHNMMNVMEEQKVHMNYVLNDNLLHFGGMDDPEKVKSSEWNYIVLEEATDFSYEDYRQLKLRLRRPSKDGKRNQMFLMFNPIDEYHWIKEKVVDDPTEDTEEIVSTYKDNPHLDLDAVMDIENLINQDVTFHNIYALGKWGRFENLIYQEGFHWDVVDYFPDPAGADIHMFGMDYGFNVESALIELIVKGKDIWEREVVYQKKLTNAEFIRMANQNMQHTNKNRVRMWADSAAPDKIKEFKEAGFSGIREAEKNVLDGINAVKHYKVHVLKSSVNLIKEKRAYSWRQDRNGRILDEPVDYKNHLMDGERYAIYNYRKRRGIRLTII